MLNRKKMIEITNLDINDLNDCDVRMLIEAEKNPDNILEYREIINQIQESLIIVSAHTYRCVVKDKMRKIIYNFQVHTTPISTNFSVGLMFLENKVHLIRLDFGTNLRHINNFGTANEEIVRGSHAHINSPAGKYTPKNVIPISEIDEFKNIKEIKAGLDEFISYTNIKK